MFKNNTLHYPLISRPYCVRGIVCLQSLKTTSHERKKKCEVILFKETLFLYQKQHVYLQRNKRGTI